MYTLIPNSEAVQSGDFIFFGGIVAKDEEGRLVGPGDVEVQTEVIIRKIAAYLESRGLGLKNLVYVNVFLTDLGLFDRMNQAYRKFMPEPLPPRKAVVTPIALADAVVEMTAIAGIHERKVLERPKKWIS